MSKARNLADLLDSNGDVKQDSLDNVPPFENITDTGTEGTKVATGTTAQRGSTAGQIRFNTELGLAEYYTGSAFKSIDSPPTITSIDVTEVDSQAGGNQTIVITGASFASGATVSFLGYTGTNFNASTVTVNSDTQITAVAPKASFLNAQEPYGVKVENVSGLSATLADQINVDSAPSWTTASGSLGTVIEDEAISTITVAASDADGDTVSYSVQTGSLPTGLSLNSSTGAITGTPNVNDTYASGGVTHNFTLRATANSKTSDRSFNIIRKWKDGSSSSAPATSATAIKTLTGTTTNGYYWLTTPSDGVARQWYCDMNTDGGGYVLIARSSGSISSNPGNWYDSANAGSFNTSSSGQYRGGGYWNNGSQSKILWEMSAGGTTTRKLRLNWGTGNFNTVPSIGHESFVTEISNGGGVLNSSFGNYSIKGNNNFTTQFLITWSFRGISSFGEYGPYFYFGQQYNGSHQHHEESITGNDGDGTGRFIYAVDWKNAVAQQTVESSTTGHVNIWCKP